MSGNVTLRYLKDQHQLQKSPVATARNLVLRPFHCPSSQVSITALALVCIQNPLALTAENNINLEHVQSFVGTDRPVSQGPI